MDGDFGEEAMAIRDAMEEEFRLIARQKSKGKMELLNLHSSINYGDAKDPSRRGKAMHTCSRLVVPWQVVGSLVLSWVLL
jgi:hypothetical protein